MGPLIFKQVLLVSVADRHLMLDIVSSDLTEYFCCYVHPQSQKEFKFGLRKIRGEWLVQPVKHTVPIPAVVISACIKRLEPQD